MAVKTIIVRWEGPHTLESVGSSDLGNAVYRDLVQAAVMVGVEHLCLAVTNVYRYRTGGRPAVSRDYENTSQVAEAIYGHSRLRLPYNLILIGY